MASHVEEYRVPFGDTDAAGVVFYPNYYRWFDRMTHELFRHAGQPLEEHWHAKEVPILTETHCTFLALVRYDDVVTLEASVAEIRDRSFRVDHVVSRNGNVVARGYEVRVWVAIDGARLERHSLPEAVRGALAGS